MADFKIELDLSELQTARKQLEQLRASMGDLRPLLEAIREDLLWSHEERAQREVDPQGHAWARLNPAYAAGKRGSRILRASGRMLSLSSRVEGDTVVIGSGAKYAATHQFGATIRPKAKKALRFQMGGRWFTKKSVTIPARPFLGVSEQDRDNMAEAVVEFAQEALGK